MPQSKFWEFVNAQQMDEDAWMHAAYGPDRSWVKARDILISELPEAEKWKQIGKSNDQNSPRVLLPELLMSLAWGSFDGKSPLPRQYEPKDITLHLSRDDFENILFQKPPRGAITFRWDIYDEDGFELPQNRETLAVFSRRTMWLTKEQTGSDERYISPTGVAFGIIRGEKLDIYPFPHDWQSVLDSVRQQMRKMTAAEKARKQLSHELKSLVDLVGWKDVHAELLKLRPEVVVNRAFVLDWVVSQMREIERSSPYDESRYDNMQRYFNAVVEYEPTCKTPTMIIELLEEARRSAEMRLANPGDAMAAEFGQEAVEIANKSIELDIETIDDMLKFLRG